MTSTYCDGLQNSHKIDKKSTKDLKYKINRVHITSTPLFLA